MRINGGKQMKKLSCLAVLSALFILVLAASETPVKALPMEIPANAAPGDGTLLVDLNRLQELSAELAALVPDADIALLDRQEAPLAVLGHIKKGKFKWGHKTRQEKFLAVEFNPAAYAMLAETIKARTPRPGFRLAVCDGEKKTVLNSVGVTFSDFADLAVQMNYPVNASPGQSLRQEVTVSLTNTGSSAAKDITLEIVLSGDDRIPRRRAPTAATYTEDALLENGREIVPLLAPGQQVTVVFSGSLKLPPDTPPGKHYLAVVADPEDSIGELSEENNIHSGFIMITVPEPAAITVEMPETVLNFLPATYGFEIVCAGTLLSDGKDWKLCRMKPSIYHLKHVSWNDFFWEVDTVAREIYEIRGADFCKKGGQDRSLKIKVEVAGGSLQTPPSRFTLKLAQTQLRYEPGSKKFSLLAYGKPIYHQPFWWVCRRESYLFQFRYALWQGTFWQVDTIKKEVSLVRDGKFCSIEGLAAAMPLLVKVEN